MDTTTTVTCHACGTDQDEDNSTCTDCSEPVDESNCDHCPYCDGHEGEHIDACDVCGECSESGCDCCLDCMETECNYCSYCDCCGSWCEQDCPGCDSCHSDNDPGKGSSSVAPWEERGIVVRNTKVSGEYDKVWELDKIDVIRAAADFYILEPMAAGGYDGYVNMLDVPGGSIGGARRHQFTPGVDTELAQEGFAEYDDVWSEAESELHNLTVKLDDVLRKYVNFATAGELRYHNAIGGTVLSEHRTMAWVGWKEVFEKVGPTALKDMASLFREMDGGSIGGERWAQAAELLYLRLTDRKGNTIVNDDETGLPLPGQKPVLPPRVFIDRVMNAQHNGGALLNKVDWRCENDRTWTINQAQSCLLPAHGREPEPDWRTLVSVASPLVVNLFNRAWDAANKVRVAFGLDERKNPWTGIEYRIMCRYCSSNPEYGHNLGCVANRVNDYNDGSLKGTFTVAADGEVTVKAPSWIRRVPEDQWPGYDWSIWQLKKYPIGIDGKIKLSADSPARVSLQITGYKVSKTFLGTEYGELAPMTLGEAWNTVVDLEGLAKASPHPKEMGGITLTIYVNDLKILQADPYGSGSARIRKGGYLIQSYEYLNYGLTRFTEHLGPVATVGEIAKAIYHLNVRITGVKPKGKPTDLLTAATKVAKKALQEQTVKKFLKGELEESHPIMQSHLLWKSLKPKVLA